MNWENLIEILIPERRSKMVDLTDAQFACNQTNSTSNNVFLKKLNSNENAVKQLKLRAVLSLR